MRILGIDPGIRNTGWGVIISDNGRLRHLGNGVIKPDRCLPDADRLSIIAEGLSKVIEMHAPDCAAIEEIFVAKSAASALKLGMARGVAMLACGQHQLNVTEIAARLVKKTVTGTGTADKRQVTDMVNRLLNIEAANADAADALAIAISGGSGVGSKQRSSGGSGGSNLSKAIEAALARDQVTQERRGGNNEDDQ